MRRYIDLVTEARRPIRPRDDEPKMQAAPLEQPVDRPTQTRTRDDLDLGFDFMPELERHAVAPVGAPGAVRPLPGRRAGRRRANPTVAPDVANQAAQHLQSLHAAGLDDEITDDEAHARAGFDSVGDDVGAIEPQPNIENLPAVIRREVAETGGRINPEWHQVKQLPGYFVRGIRALGRSIFSQFTDTPLEDLQVITTLGGINPEHDVAGMMNWIRRNGVQDDSVNFDFERIMPGYTADATLWRTADYCFLLVKDFGGYYIYGCTDGRGVHLAGRPEPRRLR